jgi:hypothetical protein
LKIDEKLKKWFRDGGQAVDSLGKIENNCNGNRTVVKLDPSGKSGLETSNTKQTNATKMKKTASHLRKSNPHFKQTLF